MCKPRAASLPLSETEVTVAVQTQSRKELTFHTSGIRSEVTVTISPRLLTAGRSFAKEAAPGALRERRGQSGLGVGQCAERVRKWSPPSGDAPTLP